MIVGTGRSLLFLHWPIAAEALRHLVPPQLTLDSFEGTAYVSLVPHAVEAARIGGAPRRLGHSFLETRLRTYVSLDGRDPGIFLLASYVSSRIALAMARYIVGLPYFGARMTLTRRGRVLDYRVEARARPEASLAVTYETGDPTGPAEPGTLDHFLVERYAQHSVRRGRILTARVRHEPYALQHVELTSLDEHLLEAAGLPLVPPTPALCHYAERVDMEFLDPRPAPD